jgi:hypothetical protein
MESTFQICKLAKKAALELPFLITILSVQIPLSNYSPGERG